MNVEIILKTFMLESGDKKLGGESEEAVWVEPVIRERLTRTGNYRAAAVGRARGIYEQVTDVTRIPSTPTPTPTPPSDYKATLHRYCCF
jgi:hypothetical protein